MKKIIALLLLVTGFNAMALGGQITCRYVNGDSWTVSSSSYSELMSLHSLCKSDSGFAFLYFDIEDDVPSLQP